MVAPLTETFASAAAASRPSTLLAVWRSEAAASGAVSVVVPDGCRDLIVQVARGQAPRWFVSSLDDQGHAVSASIGVSTTGFRLKPGTQIDACLLRSLQHQHHDPEDLYSRLAMHTKRSSTVAQALDCLGADIDSVAQVARLLATGSRTLQRLCMRETGRPPSYWVLLARARRSARALAGPLPLVAIAADHGYADQAHMSREHKRWFNASPSTLRKHPALLGQLNDPGYV